MLVLSRKKDEVIVVGDDIEITLVDIRGDQFFLNDQVTYPGRSFRGHKIEGLLLNSRMVQGVFDDLNPETRSMFDYPDGPWDPDRNTSEFIANMPIWRSAGLLGFGINFQGGSPQGYSADQPWHNSAFDEKGALRDDYCQRMDRIIRKADELGMVVILGLFYFGQDRRLADEHAVRVAVIHAVDWVAKQGYTNVLIEIANEIDVRRYTHESIKTDRCHELIELAQQRSKGKVKNDIGRLYVSASYGGCTIPKPNVVKAADFILVHGNGAKEPQIIRDMVAKTRQVDGYRGQPIVFNEDDHFEFDKEDSNFLAAVSQYASWGYFDYRKRGEPFETGYQSVPVDWSISTERKKGFFNLVAEMTGSEARF